MDNQKIGLFIKNSRKAKGYTQKELADLLNVTDRAISKWERGVGCPDISLLEDLSKALDVSVLEILKGEKLEKKEINHQDLIYSMYSQKSITLDKVKSIANFVAIISVFVFSLFMIITISKNIYFLNKTYSMKNEYSHFQQKEYYEHYQEAVQMILQSKGIYEERDYSTILSYIKIMNERLEALHSEIYIYQENYSFVELLQFYIDQQNLFSIEINNIDLYHILLKYDTNMDKNMIQYSKDGDIIKEEFFRQSMFFKGTYLNKQNNIAYDGYVPNTHYFLSLIYQRELRLCQDIIKVGELQ